MDFDADLGFQLTRIVESFSFDVATAVTSREDMTSTIRQVEGLDGGSILSPGQCAALLENFRLAVIATFGSGNVESIEKQAQLNRWRFLPQASGAVAKAYVTALVAAKIDPPPYMREWR